MMQAIGAEQLEKGWDDIFWLGQGGLILAGVGGGPHRRRGSTRIEDVDTEIGLLALACPRSGKRLQPGF